MQSSEKHEIPNQKRMSHVTPLQPIVIRPTNQAESDSSFSQYIDRQFQQPFSGILRERASLSTEQRSQSEPKTQIDEEEEEHQQPIESKEEFNIKTPPPSSAIITDLSNNKSHDLEERAQFQAVGATQKVADPWWVLHYDEDGFYSIGMLLFLFGFICPPLWWIGACWPRHPREQAGKMAERWQKLNIIMSLGFSVILIIMFIVVAVLYNRV
ncbi:hypothetical protein BDA99DRAFT_495595, partial [Phascolomyces articulosus]